MECIADLIGIIYRPLTLQFNINNNIKVYPKLTSSFPPLHHHQQQLPHPLLNPGVCLHELCQTFSISSSASSASTTSFSPSSSPSHKLIIFSCNTNNIALSNYSEAVRYEKYLTQAIGHCPQPFEIGLGCALTYFKMPQTISNPPLTVSLK